MLGTCRLCLRPSLKLCRSHVYPEFFYEHTYDERRQFISASSDKKLGARAFQSGFREYLLCAECEQRFSAWEVAAAPAVRRAWAEPPSADRFGSVVGVNTVKFRLFALSVLWRCHVARGPVFKAVKLGPHAERLRQLLVAGDGADYTIYPVSLFRVEGAGSQPLGVLFAPMSTRVEGNPVCYFFACGFRWAFVVSSRAKAVAGHLPMLVGRNPNRLEWAVVRYENEAAFMNYLARRAVRDGIPMED